MSDVPELGPPAKKNEKGTVPKKTQKKAAVEVDDDMPKELATRLVKSLVKKPLVTLRLRATKRQTKRR